MGELIFAVQNGIARLRAAQFGTRQFGRITAAQSRQRPPRWKRGERIRLKHRRRVFVGISEGIARSWSRNCRCIRTEAITVTNHSFIEADIRGPNAACGQCGRSAVGGVHSTGRRVITLIGEGGCAAGCDASRRTRDGVEIRRLDRINIVGSSDRNCTKSPIRVSRVAAAGTGIGFHLREKPFVWLRGCYCPTFRLTGRPRNIGEFGRGAPAAPVAQGRDNYGPSSDSPRAADGPAAHAELL